MTPRTRLLLYTSPSNPLGWVATEQDQERLLEFTRRHNLWLMADEVYERLSIPTLAKEDACPSILKKCTREDAVVVIQSFSKAYCMTGWRLGWLVARKDLSERASQLNEFYISHAPSFAQRAGETALLWGEDVVRQMVSRLRENRDFCMAALKKMPGVTTPNPDGAFYLFPQNRRHDRFLRLLQAVADGNQSRPGPRRRVRRRRRRQRAHLLRLRKSHSRRSHGPAETIPGIPPLNVAHASTRAVSMSSISSRDHRERSTPERPQSKPSRGHGSGA